jgi:hypothetical protein
MKKMIVIAALAAAGLMPVAAHAQERLGDAALGAVSGALVAGPIGLVAGGVVGFTAGPAIAHSWGLRHRSRPHRVEDRPAQ